MIYNNYISVKKIIAKVLTDNDLQQEPHRISDMIEWAGEAVERIGAFPELETHVTGKNELPLLVVENYQAALPTGLHSIIQVAFARTGNETGPFYPMRRSSGSFDTQKGITTIIDNTDPQNPVYGTEEEQENQTTFTSDITYVLTPGYIKTNQRDGLLMMAYTSIPVDDEGYPMIPNDEGFEDALYWYITMKLLYPMWASGRVRDAVYFNARQSWNFYSKQAYGNSLMPDADALEAIKNTWLRLVPELGDHNNFYSTTGQRQEIRNQTNRLTYLNNSNYAHNLPYIR